MQSAEHFLGSEVYGETRSATKIVKESDQDSEEVPSIKKTKTIADTTAVSDILFTSE